MELRAYRESDAEAVVSWVENERTYYMWCAGLIGVWPVTAEMLNARMRAYPNDVPLVLEDADGPAGFACLFRPDGEREAVRLGFVILDEKKRGRGLGRGLAERAVGYARDRLCAKRATLCAFRNNPAARRCYASVGFVEAPGDARPDFEALGESWERVEMEIDLTRK